VSFSPTEEVQSRLKTSSPQCVRSRVNRHFDAIPSRYLRWFDELFMACLPIKQDGFGMFAESP
jgi:hypothetical protein